MTFTAYSFPSPLGPLTLFEEPGDKAPVLTVLEWGRVEDSRETPLLVEAKAQIDAYFDGKRKDFDLPFAPAGSPFQKAVWDRMLQIPFGETLTYGQMSDTLKAQGMEASAQSVGTACGANPLPVLIPCHRVMGAGGALTGYSGGDGVETKRQLLILEGALLL